MRYTEDFDQGFAGSPFAGLTIAASAGLVSLLIAAAGGTVGAVRLLGRGVRRIATLAVGAPANAPHVALVRVPGEFVAGSWRRV